MLPVNWMRFSKNKNRPSTSRKKAGSSTIQVRDDPLRKNGEKKSRNLTISGLFPHFCHPIGGDKRDRTADLLNAIQALSQYKRVHTPQNTRLRGRFRYTGERVISIG